MEQKQSLNKDSSAESINTEEIKSQAANMADEAKRRAREQAETQKHTVADKAEDIAGSVERVADEFKDQDQQLLADYTAQLAESVKSFADTLRGRSIDDLLRDTNRLARDNPTAFLLGSVALGFALSRFIKASSQSSASSATIGSSAGERQGYTAPKLGESQEKLDERIEYNRPTTAGPQLHESALAVESPPSGGINR
jgi:hypothetical protein